ncbi:MAG: Rieske 2Fe-2S domain-containing protein [Dehalococcoidia bacterium]|nr:Rieske 2Fe-2S domain-containing protein [Dehalococcoidia bacterium]
MLSPEDNDLLCRVGAGTPMGDLMRLYWLPALLSEEVPVADGAPVRVRLLGEDLIAFRVTSGRVGLVRNTCPHRGASLFYGRNEEEGLRCVYHGWKFDCSGACVDMPSEPAETAFKDKVRAVTYPCVERGGVVWTYMGSAASPPPLPDIEPNMMPGESQVQKIMRECNWMQALEGDIDTSHFGFLHRTFGRQPSQGTFDYYMEKERTPRYKVVDTEFGTSYGAYRPAEEDTYYWRIAHFLFPFFTMIPTGVLGVQIVVRAWVPLDDEHTMFWSFMAPQTRTLEGAFVGANGQAGGTRPGMVEYAEDTQDWLGRFRLIANAGNDYQIDRESQKTRSFTGIDNGGAFLQDQAVTESMGAIFDRSGEHLGSSDEMVIRTRHRLINAARALRDNREIPPGVEEAALYRQRSGGIILPRDADWLEATREQRKGFVKAKAEAEAVPATGGG